MPFIGNQPAESYSAFQKQDFSTSATTSYTLDHPVSNQNEIALFINFVRQEPTAAYTASGTTLTLTSATSSSDDMYCVYLGKAVQTVNPPSGSVGASQLASDAVTAAKLNDDIISGQTALASEPADTDEFLVSDAGTLKRIDYSLIKGGGITIADSWRTTAAVTFSTQQTIDTNWERNDSSGTGTIGSAMTQSSGIFTFPSTGIYQVIANASFVRNGNDRYIEMHIQHSSNGGSSFNIMARNQDSISDEGANTFANITVIAHLDITNVSNDRVRFRIEAPNDTVMNGSTSQNEGQSFTFVRLGDT